MEAGNLLANSVMLYLLYSAITISVSTNDYHNEFQVTVYNLIDIKRPGVVGGEQGTIMITSEA